MEKTKIIITLLIITILILVGILIQSYLAKLWAGRYEQGFQKGLSQNLNTILESLEKPQLYELEKGSVILIPQ